MLDKTTIFAYDNSGNITSRVEYKYSLAETSNLENGYTYNYEYASQGWRDQLLSYNGAICGEYDNLGNPSVYRGKRLSWSHGRQLDSIGDITYKYNSNGVRIAKTANGVTTKFYLDGAAILAQEVGNRLMLFTRGVDGLNGFTLDGAEYFYKKNIQGDIIAIMDSTGAEIVRYVYDAWGNHKTYVLANGEYKQMSEAQNSAYVEIAQLNPYRYRSYYYDIETSLYYLNTRYYDPEVGRFINADDISKVDSKQINGLNLYAYCFNNPIYNIDPTGHKGKWWQWLIVGVLAVASVALIGFGVGAAFAAAAATVASTATSLTIVASVSVGIGVGGLIGLGTSIDEQGGIKNADPERIYNNMGAGMLTGGVIGFFSGVMSVAGGIVGSYAGFSIGNMTHIASGIKVGKVISTSLLMNSFDFIGRVAGGLMGSAFGEYLSTGNSLTPEEYTTKSAKDELPMWIINILRWLFG